MFWLRYNKEWYDGDNRSCGVEWTYIHYMTMWLYIDTNSKNNNIEVIRVVVAEMKLFFKKL